MLLNTRPRVIRITLHLAWIAMLLQDGARAFAPPPQALQWRPAACVVSARGGQRAIGTLWAGDVKKEALSESQPTRIHAHQEPMRAAKPGTAKLEAVLAPCLEVQSPAPVQLEEKPAAHTRRFWRFVATAGAALVGTALAAFVGAALVGAAIVQSPAPVQLEEKPAVDTRRFWRLVATVGAALALSVSTPAPSFAKGGGGASGGGGGGGHFHSRSYSRASRSSNVDGDSASAPGIVGLLAAAGGAALLDNLDSTATARAPSRPKRLMLTEGERRSWVVASTPLSSHAAQTRSAKSLSGSYRAEYVERGVTGKSAYRLCFADGRVTGMGWDADGDFQIDGGVFDPETGAVAWGEWTKSSGLYSEVTLLWDGEKYVGEYRSNMDMSGSLVLKPVSEVQSFLKGFLD